VRLSPESSRSTPNAARITAAFKLSGTMVRGTPPSSANASMCSWTQVSALWSNTIFANRCRL
jgi:hypothetical protein